MTARARRKEISTFTDEMLEDLKDTVLNKSPKDFGHLSSTWDTQMLAIAIQKHLSGLSKQQL